MAWVAQSTMEAVGGVRMPVGTQIQLHQDSRIGAFNTQKQVAQNPLE